MEDADDPVVVRDRKSQARQASARRNGRRKSFRDECRGNRRAQYRQGASLSPEAAARQCLFAPVSLYRQATAAGQLGDCPFPRNALFVYEIGEASRREGGSPLVFMDETWSRCPAAQWVPAMLEGVWRRAIRAA
jgi:hypothetical protein